MIVDRWWCCDELDVWYETLTVSWVYQHGENPEARLVVPLKAKHEPFDPGEDVQMWMRNVHEYEARRMVAR